MPLTFNPGTDFDYLADGGTATVVINYTVTDDDGTPLTDSSTLTITVTGSNDAPVATADTTVAQENSAVTVDVIANDSDVNTSNVLSISAASIATVTNDSDSQAVTISTASVSFNGNDVTFNPGTDFDYLASGETATVVVNYTVTDDDDTPLTNSSTLTITVTGTNDQPVATADTGAGQENSAVTVDVIANDSDPDVSNGLSVSAASINTITNDSDSQAVTLSTASVSFSGNDVTFNPGTDFDYLADGGTATVVINYTVTDDDGTPLTDSSTLTITVTGTNDAPVATADIGATQKNSAVTVDVIANDSHLDVSNGLSVSAASIDTVINNADEQSVTLSTTSVSFSGNDVTFNPGTDFDYLASGETATVVVNYTVTDDDGTPLTDSSTLTITVTGTNEAPVFNNPDSYSLIIPSATGAFEGQINTTTGSDQHQSAIAATDDGGAISIWLSESGGTYTIMGQRLTASSTGQIAGGSQFKINTGDPSSGRTLDTPDIAVLDNGIYAAVWSHSEPGSWQVCKMKVFSADGSVIKDDFNVGSSHYQTAVAALVDNQFATVSMLNGSTVKVHLFDDQGTETKVIDAGSSGNWGWGEPSITALDNGGFAVAWRTNSSADDSARIRFFDSSGNPTTGEIVFGDTNPSDDRVLSLETLSSGQVVSTYQSAGEIYLQQWLVDGTAQGSPIRINSTTAGTQSQTDITALADGSFYITWTSENQDGAGKGIYGRHFGADGVAISGETLINETTAGHQSDAHVVQLADGTLQAIWTSDHNGNNDVFSRTIAVGNQITENTANGTFVGRVVATDIEGDAITYQLMDDADGRFAIDNTTGVITVADGSKLNYEDST